MNRVSERLLEKCFCKQFLSGTPDILSCFACIWDWAAAKVAAVQNMTKNAMYFPSLICANLLVGASVCTSYKDNYSFCYGKGFCCLFGYNFGQFLAFCPHLSQILWKFGAGRWFCPQTGAFLWMRRGNVAAYPRRRRPAWKYGAGRRLLSTQEVPSVDAWCREVVFVHRRGHFCGCGGEMLPPVHVQGAQCGCMVPRE